MGFEAIRAARGQPRVRGCCEDCGREEVVAAVTGNGQKGDEGFGQAAKKLQAHGWSYIGKRLRCPSCEAKRKVQKMAKTSEKNPTIAPPAREPSRVQRRQIMEMLGEVYDLDGERFTGGETDASVADVLGVMPGWVAAIREEFFGPDGANQEMADLAASISAVEQKIAAVEKRSKVELGGLRAELKSLVSSLEAIRRAVGPHVRAKLGAK